MNTGSVLTKHAYIHVMLRNTNLRFRVTCRMMEWIGCKGGHLLAVHDSSSSLTLQTSYSNKTLLQIAVFIVLFKFQRE